MYHQKGYAVTKSFSNNLLSYFLMLLLPPEAIQFLIFPLLKIYGPFLRWVQVVYAVANEGSRLEIPEGPLGRLISGLPYKNFLTFSRMS